MGGGAGSRPAGTLNNDATYRLTCIGEGYSGTVTKAVTIDVKPLPPTCTLTVSPTSFTTSRVNATLTWRTSRAVSGEINQGVGSMTPIAGGTRSVSPTQTTIYRATVRGAGGAGEATCQVTITKK